MMPRGPNCSINPLQTCWPTLMLYCLFPCITESAEFLGAKAPLGLAHVKKERKKKGRNEKVSE